MTIEFQKKPLMQFNQFIIELKFLKEEAEINKPANNEFEGIRSRILSILIQYLDISNKIEGSFRKNFQDQISKWIKNQISLDTLKTQGLNFIKNKQIFHSLGKSYTIPAINQPYWENIKNFIFQNEKFQTIVGTIKKIYIRYLNGQIEKELAKVTITLDNIIKQEYKKAYFKSPLSFEEFLTEYSSQKELIHKKSNTISASTLREEYEKSLEKKKITLLKTKQTESFDQYQSYFNLDDRELARAKRKGTTQKHIFQKKSRREKFQK